jgi:hypothetical protein
VARYSVNRMTRSSLQRPSGFRVLRSHRISVPALASSRADAVWANSRSSRSRACSSGVGSRKRRVAVSTSSEAESSYASSSSNSSSMSSTWRRSAPTAALTPSPPERRRAVCSERSCFSRVAPNAAGDEKRRCAAPAGPRSSRDSRCAAWPRGTACARSAGPASGWRAFAASRSHSGRCRRARCCGTRPRSADRSVGGRWPAPRPAAPRASRKASSRRGSSKPVGSGSASFSCARAPGSTSQMTASSSPRASSSIEESVTRC